MFEEHELIGWEVYYFYFLGVAAIIPLSVMAIDRTRGNFVATYVYMFVLSGLWNLGHGFSTVDDQIIWGEVALKWFDIKQRTFEGSKPVYKGSRRGLFLINHSCMADIFLVDVILQARANFLARYGALVFGPLPMFLVCVFMHSIFFFKRGGRGEDLEPFFKELDANLNWFHTQRFHFGGFPEGHRNVKPYMLPLKEGIIRYAYERGLLVQPIIIFGVEQAMNEYTLRKDWSQEGLIEYYADDVFDPKNFKTRKDFHNKIEDRMFELFDTLHDKASKQNQRFKYLRHEDEKKAFESAKNISQRSRAMVEYVNEQKKKKRH